MAAEEKTEEPTAKRKADARKKGNIPKSRDLSSAMLLLAAIYLLKYLGPKIAEYMSRFTRKVILEDLPNLPAPERKEVLAYALDWVMWLSLMTMPVLLLMALASILAGYYQVGVLFTSEPLKLKFSKLNPVAGLKRMFSTRNVVMLVMNLAKLSVVMSVAWHYMSVEFRNALALVEMETIGTFIYTSDKTLTLARNLALLLLVLGLADHSYQKYKTNKEMKMTKQEIKEEFKQMEGDPKVKQKRRQKQMEMAMKRMMGEVPQAEVVVRNPTHYAVAISYKPDMPAPKVVAKGKGKTAERIIELARKSGVPMVENPPLARELYRVTEIDETIPQELFVAVAEILASVLSGEKLRALNLRANPAA